MSAFARHVSQSSEGSGAIGVIARSAIAGFLLLHCATGCRQDAPVAEAPPPKVTVQHPESRELLDYDEYNGWTDASATVEVRSRVRGHIDRVSFTDGQIVNKGDVLFEIDPRPFQAELDRATEEVKISEAQQLVSTTELARYRDLYKRDATTIREVERAEAQAKSWEARVSSGQEEIKRRALELSYCKVDAPIGGKVSRAMLTEGNLVNAGGSDPVLTTIVNQNPIDVFFSVDERSLLRYREQFKAQDGDLKSVREAKIPFEFGLETDAGYPHRGTIDFADNRIDPATGTIEVRGKAENGDGRFVPGGRVRIRVAVRAAYQAVLIPDVAVLTDQDKKYLLCVNDEKVVVRRDVQLGRLLDDGMRVVLASSKDAAGLQPSDWVIVLGLQRARVNYPVDPVDAQANQVTLSPSTSPTEVAAKTSSR